MTETHLRAAGYIRVSTSQQAEEGESLNTQRRQIEAYCQLKKWELVKIFEDRGVSGAKSDRPGLNSLLEAAKNGDFKAVVCTDLSRFGRNTRDLLNNVQDLKDHKVDFASIKEGVTAGPYGDFMISVLASIAQLEREVIMVRTKENKMARWSKKEIYNGKLPYGYRWSKENKAPEPHPDEAPIFQRIISEYLDHNKSLKEVCIILNDEHIPTRIRGRWSSGTVSTMLKNDAYHGIHIVNRHILDENGNIKGDKPVAEHITYNFPPLLTKARWDFLQQRLANGKVDRGGRPSSLQQEFLLYGVLKCGFCGGRISPCFHSSRPRKDGTRARFYGCYWHQTSGKTIKEAKRDGRCPLEKIPAEHIEDFFWESFLYLFKAKRIDYEEIFKTENWAAKEETAAKKIKSIRTDLRKAHNVLKNLKGLLELDNVDLRQYATDKAEAENRIRELELSLKESDDELAEIQQLRQQKEEFVDFAENQKELLQRVEEILNNLSIADKQRLIASMLEGGKIQVGPYSLEECLQEDSDEDIPMRYGWFDRLDYTWRPNLAVLKEILDPYLNGPGGGNGGGEKGAGKSCTGTHLPGQIHAHRRDEPVSLRLFGRPGEALRLPSKGRDEIPEQDFRTDPRQNRPAHRGPFA